MAVRPHPANLPGKKGLYFSVQTIGEISLDDVIGPGGERWKP